MIPRALRETQTKQDHATLVGNIFRGVFVWLLLVGVVGLPYWIVWIPFHDVLLGKELLRQLAQSPVLWFTFGSLSACHFWRAFRMGYDTMPDKELKQTLRWDLYSPHPAPNFSYGRERTLLHSGAADGGATDLSRSLARARDRRGLRRSVAALGI